MPVMFGRCRLEIQLLTTQGVSQGFGFIAQYFQYLWVAAEIII